MDTVTYRTILSLFYNIFQEQQKEADELKQITQNYGKKEEECTIRTNSQPEPPMTDPMTNR